MNGMCRNKLNKNTEFFNRTFALYKRQKLYHTFFKTMMNSVQQWEYKLE